jgi:hypothetical protein
MKERPVIVEEPVIVKGSNTTGPAAIAGIVLIVAIVALFIWKPWNTSTSTTVINQPATAASDSAGTSGPGAASSGSTP